jgi:hypothetical protein
MGLSLEKYIAWLTAFAVVFSLYAHTVFGIASSQVTPIAAFVIAGGLLSMCACWTADPMISVPTTAMRQLGAMALWLAWGALLGIGLAGFFLRDEPPSLNDWGLFALQVGALPLLLFNNQRAYFINAIGSVCVGFALIDAVASFGDLAGFWRLAEHGGRFTDTGIVERIPGLTGNSHAAGLVALVACCFVATRLQFWRAWRGTVCAAAVLTILFGSLILSDARRYIGEAVLCIGLVGFQFWRFAPLQLLAPTLGAAGVWYSFTHWDSDNVLRADLMADGWREAADHVLIGDGVTYRVIEGGGSYYLRLANVTESGVIDFALAYGWLATGLLILALVFSLSGARRQLFWPVGLLTVLSGELAYGNPLEGFLGAIMFFGSLLFALVDETRLGSFQDPYPRRTATLARV